MSINISTDLLTYFSFAIDQSKKQKANTKLQKKIIFVTKIIKMIKIQGRTRNILLIAGTLITLFMIWYFSSIVTYILISVVLSFIGRPLVRWLQLVKIWKVKIGKTLAAFVTLIVLWIAFIGFFRFIIPLLISEFETLSTIDFNAVLETIQEPLSRIASFTSGEKVAIDNQSFFDILQEQLSTKFDFFDNFPMYLG